MSTSHEKWWAFHNPGSPRFLITPVPEGEFASEGASFFGDDQARNEERADWALKALTACYGMEDPVRELAELRQKAQILESISARIDDNLEAIKGRGVGALLRDHVDALQVSEVA